MGPWNQLAMVARDSSRLCDDGPMDTTPVTTIDELTEIVGTPTPAAANKERSVLTDLDRQWLAAARFCVLATADAAGNCDASPKGDPAGELVHIIDDRTIAIAERPGNRRVDGYRNVLGNPHVGLLFPLGGRDDTLRINGRAQIVSDAPFFNTMAVRGKRPILALIVHIDTIFHHCGKAFMRSELWNPETWNPTALPRRAVIAKTLDRPDDDLAELDEYYGPSYARHLY